MTRYLLKRLFLIIPTLILVATLVFALIRLIPGDALMLKLGERRIASDKDVEQLKAELGLDKPIYVQYLDYMWALAKGDLGKSLWGDVPVSKTIFNRLPVTFELALLAWFVSLGLSIPIGVWSAIRQDTLLDYFLRAVSIAGLSIPTFWLGTMAVLLPALWFRWTPPIIYVSITENPLAHMSQIILPAFILGIGLSAQVMRMTRTMMLEVLGEEYIRTARAKGLQERVVVIRHGLKNALIPVMTVLGDQMAFLIGGAIVLESIFGLPGMGRLLLDSIQFRDYPLIQGVTLFVAVWLIVVNLIVDMTYPFLDPRINR